MGARVRAENTSNGLVRELATGEDGKVRLLALPPGAYKVTIDAKGFRRVELDDLILTVGQHAQVPVRLQVSPLSQELDILVAAANSVDTSRQAVSTTIDQMAIQNLPSNGRNYVNFTLLDSATTRDNQPILAPAPTSGLNINGQRARANMVSIDGVDAIDNTVNGVRATLSQEAVQEFQLIKSGYAPEYGRASSAVINIVSKQGSNQWKGSLFGYLRNRNVSATNAFPAKTIQETHAPRQGLLWVDPFGKTGLLPSCLSKLHRQMPRRFPGSGGISMAFAKCPIPLALVQRHF